MANAVIANWDGHDYQARYFWLHASGLRDPDKAYVIEVSYEADGPKGFDDVVVRYSPGLARRRPFNIEAAHHQIKFHVNQAGRFGYADLISPDFVGATRFSILQRLKDAVDKAPPNSTFTLVTTDRILDADPLRKLIRSADNALDTDKLLDNTTDISEMGKIRKLWREHLGLDNDEQLRPVLETFHIVDGHYSLQDMRDHVDLRFQVVGLSTGGNNLEFKFDGAARALKATNRNVLDREAFEKLCNEQGWIKRQQEERRKNISIRSFADGPSDYLEATTENSLSLLQHFSARHLQPGADWDSEVRPKVEEFLIVVRKAETRIRLYLDSHLSIAFLAGSQLDFKSSLDIELVQKGRRAPSVWNAADGQTGAPALVSEISVGTGNDVAIAVSISRNAFEDVKSYIETNVRGVGRILHVMAATGTGPSSLAGGEHAAALADQIADAVRDLRAPPGARTHVFLSAPNAFAFYLGQHREFMGPITLYEFDFSRVVDGSYHPSFRIG